MGRVARGREAAHHNCLSIVAPWVVTMIEIEREADGRWIGEEPELPGVLAYGAAKPKRGPKATALTLRALRPSDRAWRTYTR